MALLIFPIGILLGWVLRPPRRAAVATQTVGFGVLVVLSLLWGFAGVQVSPWESLVLVVATPLAGLLASWVARWRLSRSSAAASGGDLPRPPRRARKAGGV